MNPSRSILVVDDHPTNRQVLRAFVANIGYEPLQASDGYEALELIQAHRPALVISDILMPRMDGFELVKRLRANPVLADTKVIFCTATYREREAEQLARAGGVFRVLVKPYRPVELRCAIEEAIEGASTPAPMPDSELDAERVRMLNEKLLAHEAALLRAQRVAKLAHVVTGPEGDFETWSETLPELIGVSDEGMPRTTRAWLEFVHPDEREALRQMAIAAATSGERKDIEYRLRRPDGNWAVIAHVTEPMKGDRSIGRWFTTMQDVTSQKQTEAEVRRLNTHLERLVAERTAELEAAMRELEAFDYSISHDLRGPINRIRGFASILLDDHASSLSEGGREMLTRMCASVDGMDELVADLFSLSTVSRGELVRMDVDLSALAGDVAATLARSSPERKVEVLIEPGMRARADLGLARILLENLVGNAWKYSSRREEARIEIGTERGGTSPTFFVRDNGAGFDATKVDTLFRPFRRLHSKSEFEGTGIGLATVDRIVRRHGGRAWAEGEVDKGATFRFTLAP